jgi:hypothetical protein
MLRFLNFVAEENKLIPLHVGLQTLGPNYSAREGMGARTYFRGPENNHFEKVDKMLTDRGYKKKVTRYGDSVYHKPSKSGGTHTATVSHDGDHVSSVRTLTVSNRY